MYCTENSIPAKPQALWHRLMAYNNELGWKNEFSITHVRLADDLCMSRHELDRARNVLVQKGLITYKKGSGSQCGSYHIISLCNKTGTSNDTQDDTQGDTYSDTQGDTRPVPLNRIDKKRIDKKENIKEKIENYTSNSKLRETLFNFVTYRKEIKKPVTMTALSAILNKLDKYSAGYQAKNRYKCDCLNESIANNWQGIFELKNFEDSVDEKSEEQKKADNNFEKIYEQYEAYARSYAGSIVDMLSFEEWSKSAQ